MVVVRKEDQREDILAMVNHKSEIMTQRKLNNTIHRAAISFIAAFCLILVGCGKSDEVVYTQFAAIDASGWERMGCVEFKLDSAVNVDDRCDVLLVVRHSNEYRYRSLCLTVEEMSLRHDVKVDTIEIPLATPSGEWQGRGSGRLYEVVDTLCRNVTLSADHLWTVGHAMRENPLVGVNDIGIVIKRRNN